MIENSRIFTDVFGEIVSKVRARYTIDNILPYYLYGHYKAIANELLSQDGSSVNGNDKYPLVILGIDPEYTETDINDSQYSVSANIWIVEYTKEEWYTSERFTEVYKKVLFPIYELLKDEIVNSKYVSSLGIQDFAPRVDLIPYWGTETSQGSEKQLINDPLDAMRFKINDLLVNNNKC